MIRYLNLRKIIIVVVILAAFHLGVGLFVSPLFTSFAIDKINQYSGSKIYLEKFNFWPLTLSFALKNLKVFNPDNENERIIQIADASVYISPFGLLSNRFVLSGVRMNDVQVNLQGEPDGTFNIQKLARKIKTEDKKGSASVPEVIIKNKDTFTKVYDILKNKFSKDALAKQKAKQKEAQAVKKEVVKLPKGRRVYFKAAADRYTFEVNDLSIRNAKINVKTEEGKEIEIDQARLDLGKIALDPVNGARFGKFNIAADIKGQGIQSGSIQLSFLNIPEHGDQKAVFDIALKDLNLKAWDFFYQDSIPVRVLRGTLNLKSKTTLADGNISSENSLSLMNHQLMPKEGQEDSAGFMPLPVICDTLNKINPVNLSFEIGGSVEKPEFKGFQKSLMALVMSNTQVIQEQLINKGIEALGEYFKKKKKKKSEEQFVPETQNPAPAVEAAQPEPQPQSETPANNP